MRIAGKTALTAVPCGLGRPKQLIDCGALVVGRYGVTQSKVH